MFTTILVPLDGSELAEHAVEPAFTLAQQMAGEVTLLRVPVVETVMLPDMAGSLLPAGSSASSHKEAVDYLLAQQQRWANVGVFIRTRVVEGSVADVIVDVAADEKADLIVMSSHGAAGLTRWVLGSVAERVLHAASCPVLVIRSSEPIRHILIPLDGSPLAEQALQPGLEIATALKANVTLLRAIRPVKAETLEQLEQVEQGLGRRLEAGLNAEADEYLIHMATANRPTGVEMKTVVVTDQPADAILNYVEYHAVDVVVMSTHGYTGLKRWTYGSVTDKVLHGARRNSMLVVRAN